jgi:hypothetical protein
MSAAAHLRLCVLTLDVNVGSLYLSGVSSYLE